MSLHPKIIDLTLGRVNRLLNALGNPQNTLPPVIHIAGTNGKGSTQAMVMAGIEGWGKTAHAYTSPHLTRFHERIKIAGKPILEPDLMAILEECEIANGDIPITYFEITTVAGLLAFARTHADYTILEVGLGGRLDATNVIDTPELTIITPISIDHQQFLGETLPEIAAEKAGIIKYKCPCIVGKQQDAALEVIENQAHKLQAPLHVYGQNWHVQSIHGRLEFQDENGLLDLPLPVLLGNHQVENAGMAIAALRLLGAPNEAIEYAMLNAKWPARMQKLTSGPLIKAASNAEIWLDGGHNPAAGQALAKLLSTLPKRETFAICGMLNTKDVAGFLTPIAPYLTQLYGVSIPNEKATLTADETVEIARTCKIDAETAPSVLEAICTINTINKNARILICGSLYLAGSILKNNS